VAPIRQLTVKCGTNSSTYREGEVAERGDDDRDDGLDYFLGCHCGAVVQIRQLKLSFLFCGTNSSTYREGEVAERGDDGWLAELRRAPAHPGCGSGRV